MTLSPRVAIALACAALAAACAARRGPTAAACNAPDIDPTWLTAGPVYRACEVDRPARLENPDERFDFHPLDFRPCYSALLQFVVDSAGAPETRTASVIRNNSPQFAQAIVASLSRWRYRPALKNGIPVRQVVQGGRSLVVTVVSGGAPRMPPVHTTSCVP